MIDVFSLAEQDTRLHRESVRENAGPCPDIHCRCQTNGFRVKWNGEKWVFMCRGCWDSEDYLSDKDRKRGWGDEIDYLRHYRKMSFKQAKAFLVEQGNDVDYVPQREPVLGLNYLSDLWQKQTHDTMMEHKDHLWNDDTTALDYVRSRGLEDATIEKARLGYSLTEGIPRLLIPSINEHRYVAVHRRDLRPDISKEDRWKDAKGGTKSELYLADSLTRKMPTILCEDALSALSVVQEAPDLVNVVATCGADCGQQVKWLARLARQPLVLVALDADAAGDENAQWWLDRLPNSQRLRPLLKDVNDMLMQGWDVREWIQNALQGKQTDDLHCIVCGTEVEYYSPEEIPYCSEHWHALQPITDTISIIDEPVPFTSQEQFTQYARRLVESVFGPCEMRVLPKGYTHAQRITDLGLKTRDLGMYCSVCRYERAVVLWIGGQPYCQHCQDKEKAKEYGESANRDEDRSA